MSKNETERLKFPNELDFSLECLLERRPFAKKNSITDIFEHIWHGGMPGVLQADAEQRQEYFNSYIETYLMRDVSEEGKITDIVLFRKFLNACAALTAEQINYKTLAEAAEISQPTAKGKKQKRCLKTAQMQGKIMKKERHKRNKIFLYFQLL